MKNGLVITVEGIGTGLVGAYGASGALTPAIDRLAGHGLVLDQCSTDSLDLTSQLQSLWQGRHAVQGPSQWSIWRLLSDQGLGDNARLVTDCHVAAELAESMGCQDVVLVDTDANSEPCDDATNCSLIALFAAAAQLLESQATGLVWVHSRGLRHCWDAPVALREKFVDPEDPSPPSEVELPCFSIDSGTDPDLVVGWGQVAAAQTSVVDQAVEWLISVIESRSDASSWSVTLATFGGVPLGEHSCVGWVKPQCYSEQIACVAIVQPSVFAPVGTRNSALCQLPDLTLTILDCLLPGDWSYEETVSDAGLWGRSALRLKETLRAEKGAQNSHTLALLKTRSEDDASTTWVRSPAWSALLHAEAPNELYLKPDDRWEVSDVASRRADILELLSDAAAEFQKAAAEGHREQLPELDEELIRLIR